jgi:hypothetical protein
MAPMQQAPENFPVGYLTADPTPAGYGLMTNAPDQHIAERQSQRSKTPVDPGQQPQKGMSTLG